jgi:hypothetical protein
MRAKAPVRSVKKANSAPVATPSGMGSQPRQSSAHREDAEDYKEFEAAVTAGFDAETAVERELVLRLASLLWRLRRATAIDTGLLEASSERDAAPNFESFTSVDERGADGIAQIGSLENHRSLEDRDDKGRNDTLNSEIARRFLQLDCDGFERLGRYETALWRQVYQVIFVLDVLRRRNLDRSWLPRSSLTTRFRPFGSFFAKALRPLRPPKPVLRGNWSAR